MTETTHLLDPSLAEDIAARWQSVQAHFVDDPQDAVRAADALVEEAMSGITRSLSETTAGLRAQWDAGQQPETEVLRHTLQQYRSALQRLLDR